MTKGLGKLCICFLVLAALMSCSKSEKEKQIELKSFVEKKCNMCHSSKKVFLKPRTAKDWEGIVSKMRSKNPSHISIQEADKIFKFLYEVMGADEEESY